MKISSKLSPLSRFTLLTLALATLCGYSSLLADATVYVVDDRLGVGTDTPSETVHVESNGAQLLVEDSSAAVASRVLFKLVNNGKVRFLMSNLEKDTSWTFDNSGAFTVSLIGSGANELILSKAGNLDITGILTEGSSRDRKERLQPIDSHTVLEKVVQLPVREWSYKGQDERHVGPMAEDFHHAFGLGESPTGLSTLDTSGVALAAIQGLHQQGASRDQQLAEVMQALEALTARLDQLNEVESLSSGSSSDPTP